MLCAQRSDWQQFRQYQQRQRRRYRNESFGIFLNKVRERRRAHGLDDNVHLLLDSQEQSRQQNWIEFQDYHLKLHERQEQERDGLQKDLRPISLDFAERTLRWHEVMLWWIEEHRLAMDPLPPTPVEKGSGDPNSSSNYQRRSTRRDTPAVLGKVRVSKSTPKCQNIRTRTSKATTSKPIFVDSAVTIPNSTQKQMPIRREVKPRRAKEKALGQLLSQRVAKANRVADTVTRSRSRTQGSGDGQIRDRARPQRRSATQRPYSTPRTIKTRTQRIAREPVS